MSRRACTQNALQGNPDRGRQTVDRRLTVHGLLSTVYRRGLDREILAVPGFALWRMDVRFLALMTFHLHFQRFDTFEQLF